MVLLLLLGGCIEHPLTPDESVALRRGGAAAVLVRFVGHDQDGDRLEPFAGWDPAVRIGIAIGDFDSGGLPIRREVRTLGPAARDEGWLLLVLAPGYHYLVFGVGDALLRAETRPRWRVEVPRGAPAIYAGTFHLSGRSEYVLFEGRRIVRIDQAATTVEDETEAAAQAARRDLPELPPPVTRLAVLHTGPILLGMPPPLRSSE